MKELPNTSKMQPHSLKKQKCTKTLLNVYQNQARLMTNCMIATQHPRHFKKVENLPSKSMISRICSRAQNELLFITEFLTIIERPQTALSKLLTFWRRRENQPVLRKYTQNSSQEPWMMNDSSSMEKRCWQLMYGSVLSSKTRRSTTGLLRCRRNSSPSREEIQSSHI